MIKYYWSRQDERIERNQFVIERGLLDKKKIPPKGAAPERKKSKEERDIINSIKIFSRFNTPKDHDCLVNNLVKEK
jgi:transcriptional adapter 2-alpha